MFYRVDISAESVDDANLIIDALLDQKLVTGGQCIETPARFPWKGVVIDQQYATATSFTTAEHRESITRIAEEVSNEEVPMICSIQFEANSKLADWITDTVGGH